MKTFKKFGLLFFVAVASLTVASCSDDNDDDNGGGKVSAVVGGTSMPLSHAYWYFDDNTYGPSGNNKNLIIEFYSFDVTNVSPSNYPKNINFLSIDYDVPVSQTDIVPVTVESRDYHIYLAQNVSMTSEGWQGETDWRATDNSPVIITRDGDTYTVTISSAKIYGDDDDTKELKFSYTGPISFLPENFRED